MIEDFELHAQADVISHAGSGGYLLAYQAAQDFGVVTGWLIDMREIERNRS